MRGIEIRHLRYFRRVADHLHFGRAAEVLGVSQAPLSQQIRQLEERIGVRLFDRNTRNVRLTPTGRVFVEKVDMIMNAFGDAIDDARMAGGLGSGVLRIGTVSSAVYAIVPRTIASFAKKHSRARLDMQVSATERQLELLTSRRIDIALLRPPRIVSGLETREICREGFVAVIHEASPLADLGPLTIKELKGENFIGFNEIRGHRLLGYRPPTLPCVWLSAQHRPEGLSHHRHRYARGGWAGGRDRSRLGDE